MKEAILKYYLHIFFSLLIITSILAFSHPKENVYDCCKDANKWEKLFYMADSCVSLMDFKSQENKDKVLKIYARMQKVAVSK